MTPPDELDGIDLEPVLGVFLPSSAENSAPRIENSEVSSPSSADLALSRRLAPLFLGWNPLFLG